MTGASSHSDVNEILPWYANGTLAAGERQQVERHLEQCADCRDELTLLRAVASAAGEIVADAPVAPDALDDVFARIDALAPRVRPERPSRLGALVDSLLHPPPAIRWVLAAQFAVIIGLGAVILLRPAAPGFATLSGPTGTTGVGVRLTVTFQPAATADAIRQALRTADANLVAGPSAAGVYVVELPMALQDSAVQAAIATLRGNTAVISFVERQP